MKVKEVLKRLNDEGWELARQAGSHRQFRHALMPDRRVTVSGHPRDEIAEGTRKSIFWAGWMGVVLKEYTVIIERAGKNYSAYSPDVPGCVATGKSVEDAQANFRDALQFHFDGLRADGIALPQPSTVVRQVQVAA